MALDRRLWQLRQQPGYWWRSEADLQAQADRAAMDRQLQQQQYERETRQRAIIGTLAGSVR
jgi:hypothetical protein